MFQKFEKRVHLDGGQGEGARVGGEQAVQGNGGVGLLKPDVALPAHGLRPRVCPLHQLQQTLPSVSVSP